MVGVDADRAPVIIKMFEKVAYEKWSGPKLYHWLRFELMFQTAGKKPLKDGTTARYVYYGCGRTRDKQCKGNTYLREEELVGQLLGIIDQIDLNQLGVQMRFEEELKRYNKFQRTVLGLSNPKAKHEDTDIRVYAKYILKEGTNEERREMLGCFKSKIKITKGIVTLQN